MLCVAKSLRGVVVACLVFGGVVLVSPPALADAPASGGSVIITAVIAPVRSIVVDRQDTVLEITSNSPDAVIPSVYKDKLDTKPVALTPAIYSQYAAIIRHVDLHKAGVVYRLDGSTGNKLTGWRGRTSLSGYQSILLRPYHAF